MMAGHRRCNCVACYGFRLAARMLTIGLIAVFLLGGLLRAREAQPLLIEDARQ